MTATTAAAIETPATTGRSSGPSSGMIQVAILIVVGVLATTLAQPQVLGRLPFQNMFKNELHLPRAENAAFFFLAGLPWYFKPFAGILTDAFPIFGQRRVTYLVISSVLATLAWVAIYYTPHDYGRLLWMCIVLSLFMVVASTVIGAFMVEIAQATAGSGRLTAIRQTAQMLVTFIGGPTSGFLASIAFGWTAAASGAAMFILVPATIFFLHEKRMRVDSREMLASAGQKLVTIGVARVMWAAAAVTAVIYLCPQFATALFYKQQNDLHMLPNGAPGAFGFIQGQGFLSVIGASAGMAAAAAYAWACRRHDLRTMLAVCLAANAVATAGLFFYTSVRAAQIMAAVGGFGGTLVELAMMDLAVRATPLGAEGLGFALMMSVRNVCLLGADPIGSWLLDKRYFTYDGLVWLNIGWFVACVALAFVLPAHLMRRKDAEVLEEYPEPVTMVQE